MKPIEPEGMFSGIKDYLSDRYMETAVSLQMRLLDLSDGYDRIMKRAENAYFGFKDDYKTAIDDTFSITDPAMLGLYLGKAAEDYGLTIARGNEMAEANEFLYSIMDDKGLLNGTLEYSGMDFLTLSSLAGVYYILNRLVEEKTGKSLEPEMKLFLYAYMAYQISNHMEGAKSWLG